MTTRNLQPTQIFPAVAVLIEKSGEYVLVQESKPGPRFSWALPGGAVEPGENLIEAAKREVLEEAGLLVDLIGLVRLDVWPSHEEPIDTWLFHFFAREVGGSLKTQEDEHSIRAGWFPPNEIAKLDLRGRYSQIIPRLINDGVREATLMPVDMYQIWP